MADIFLSYARADQQAVSRLVEALDGAGYSVWWDRHIAGGAEFSEDIERELNAASAAVVAWSKESVSSRWVRDEAGIALETGKLVAISLDGTPPPIGFKQIHAIDFSGDQTVALADLERSLSLKLGDQAPSSGETSSTAHEAPSPNRTQSFKPMMLVGIIALLAMIAGGFWWSERGEAGDSVAGEIAGADKSVAVLPFVTRSSVEDDQIFAEGMHDDLLTQLSKISGMRVISRTSMTRYADTEKSIPVIAEELGVAAILEGGIQRAGDRVRINVQLIDGKTDEHLWAETYDRELTAANLFEIQSEITRAIAGELNAALSSGDEQRLAERPTDDDAAYSAYLRGIALSNYDALSAERMQSAIAAFEDATARDPDFAEAWGGKASAHLFLWWWNQDRDTNAAQARAAIDRVAQLQPESATRYALEGEWYYRVEENYTEARGQMDRALELTPNSARYHTLAGSIARRSGRIEDAVGDFARVVELNPGDVTSWTDLAYAHALIGQYEAANSAMEQALALDPESNFVLFTKQLTELFEADREAIWQSVRMSRQRIDPNDPFDVFALSQFVPSPYLEDRSRLEDVARSLRRAATKAPDRSDLLNMLADIVAIRLGEDVDKAELSRQLGTALEDFTTFGPDTTVIAYAYALTGDEAAARSSAERLLASRTKDQLWLVEGAAEIIFTYALIGDIDAALDLIEETMDTVHVSHFGKFRIAHALSPYRDHPRYKALERRYLAWQREQG